MGRRADDGNRREWVARLQRRRESGLTVAEFCEWDGVSVAAFYKWQKTLCDTKSPRSSTTICMQISIRVRAIIAESRVFSGSRPTVESDGGALLSHATDDRGCDRLR